MNLANHSVSPLASAVPPVPPKQWTLTQLPTGNHELKLWGKFPPRWLANLTGGLAAQGLGIERGHASKLSPTVWQGTIELRAAAAFPHYLDFTAMAQDSFISGGDARIRLDSFTVTPQEKGLYVELCGEDTAGFLMTILKLFTFFSLYPVEVSIDTPRGRVHDRFWLKGMGGTEPTAEVRSTLQVQLAKFLPAAV